MVEYKDMYIKYINSKVNPSDIMNNNCSEDDCIKKPKRITEGELWGIVGSGKENIKNNGVLGGFMDFDSTEYSSHTLDEGVNGENRNYWILVILSSIGK